MAKRSGTPDANEALELFLDAISNAFGGILFIALLVCVLLQLSGSNETTRPTQDPIGVKLLENKLQYLRNRIAELEDQQERQEQQIRSLAGTSADVGLLVKYARLTADEQKELAELLEKTQAATILSNQTVDLEQLLEELRKDHVELEDQIRIAKDKLVEETSRTPQVIHLPSLKALEEKKEVAILISDDRMRFLFKYDKQGKPVAMNTDEVVQDARGGGARPKPGRGRVVENTDAFRDRFRRRLAQFPKDGYYFNLVVWPDSYEACEVLRDLFIDEGYNYSLLLMKEGESIPFGQVKPTGF